MEWLKPNLHIFIDIDPEIAIERISKIGHTLNFMKHLII